VSSLLIQGGVHKDTRGVLYYVNEDNPGFYRRFYIINHHDTTTVRAWQGHKIEEKAFYVTEGSFTIAVVCPVNFDEPDENQKPKFYQLSAENHLYLRVPGGNYTGIKALTENSTLLVLSSLNLLDSQKDDFRQPANRWVDWNLIK
jgi:dTDP-4-dehydrorhamnose 3,5-epimerase